MFNLSKIKKITFATTGGFILLFSLNAFAYILKYENHTSGYLQVTFDKANTCSLTPSAEFSFALPGGASKTPTNHTITDWSTTTKCHSKYADVVQKVTQASTTGGSANIGYVGIRTYNHTTGNMSGYPKQPKTGFKISTSTEGHGTTLVVRFN